MVDAALLVAFIALPIAAWLISRSLLFVSVWLGLGIGIAGNVVQGTIALGLPWNVRGLQILVVVVMVLVVVLAVLRRTRSATGSLVRQLVTIVVPAVVIGAYLLAMRLLAPDSPGPLSAVGYLINHPQAEDNAKWLHLSAQLADGREIAFSGYAGGPLLLVMAAMAALISVLSMLLLGGVNEVAVAANTVVGTQFLLIALVPFALAVFAEKKVNLSSARDRVRAYVPAVLVWASMLVVVLASAVITSYGHLSLQFVFLVLVGWLTVFVMSAPRWLRLAASLTVVTMASVWLPMTVVAVVLVIALVVWTIRDRWWAGFAAVGVAIVASWDALFSSMIYLVGIDASSIPVIGAILSPVEGEVDLGPGPSGEVIATAHLFRAPGATEVATPLLGALAVVVLLAAVWVMSRRGDIGWKFAPVVLLGAYAGFIAVMDSVTTATSPNYSLNKLLFALVIVVIAAYLPAAFMALDFPEVRMTALRWAAAAGVVVLLTVDTLLPRALSALSPLLWPSIDSSSPVYWSAAEVKNQGEQPISSLPVACLLAPPQAAQPTSLPLGQESYSCTRLLIGLTGLEGSMRGTPIFLQTDWLSQRSNWDELSGLVAGDAAANPGRSVIVMNPTGGLAGIALLEEIVERNQR